MTPAAGLQAVRDRAVACMNAGHAQLLRDELAGATASYTQAIDLLRTLPLRENPSWANSLGAAHMNRGHLLHRSHGVAHAGAALEDFESAIAILEGIPGDAAPWARCNLAGTLLNRANLRTDLGRVDEARADARRSLDLVDREARENPVAAELALKAGRVLCDAIGQAIHALPAGAQAALADEASDVVDDALALIRHWTHAGCESFAPLAVRFFRYGAELYRRHQPRFLAEFIVENLDAAPAFAGDLRMIALQTLDAALADSDAPAFFAFGDPASTLAVETHRALAGARAALAGEHAVA